MEGKHQISRQGEPYLVSWGMVGESDLDDENNDSDSKGNGVHGNDEENDKDKVDSNIKEDSEDMTIWMKK